jgi:hypothetical protein
LLGQQTNYKKQHNIIGKLYLLHSSFVSWRGHGIRLGRFMTARRANSAALAHMPQHKFLIPVSGSVNPRRARRSHSDDLPFPARASKPPRRTARSWRRNSTSGLDESRSGVEISS